MNHPQSHSYLNKNHVFYAFTTKHLKHSHKSKCKEQKRKLRDNCIIPPQMFKEAPHPISATNLIIAMYANFNRDEKRP